MAQGKGATLSQTDDVTDVRGPSQREAPGLGSRRMSTVSLPSPTPNEGMEPTPSSVRSCLAPAFGRGSCPALGVMVGVVVVIASAAASCSQYRRLTSQCRYLLM